jgi:tetratricopeptide (TPR) repeat protein
MVVTVFQSNPSRIFRSLGLLLCLSAVSTSGLAVRPGLAAVEMLAQAAPTSVSCPAERHQNRESVINLSLEQAQQAVNNRQPHQAAQLLVYALQGIQAMENSPAKADLLQRAVGSVEENVGYTSPLERLVQMTAQAAPDVAQRALVPGLEVTRSLGGGYSAAKTRTFVALANYYTQLGQPERSGPILAEALTASNGIQGAAFQLPALRKIAAAYINAGQVEAALPILARSQAAAQAMSATNPSRAAELEGIASLYAQANQLEQAQQVVRLIEPPGYPSNALLTVVDQYSEAGQIDRALAVLPALKQPEQKALAQATIAGRLTTQQPERSAQLYAEAIATARSAQNASRVVADAALRYATTGGMVAIADETLLTLTDSVVKAPALGAIALQYAKAGREDLAEARLTQAVGALEAIPEDWSRNSTRQRLIDQAVQLGRYDYALQVVQTIQPGEEFPYDRVDALTPLAERAIAAGRFDAALQITEQIPPSFVSWRDRLFLQIAAGLVNSGDFIDPTDIDRALEIARQENPDPGFQPRVLAVIASHVRPPEQAAVLFGQAIQLANAIDDAYTRTEVLAAIATAYFDAKLPSLGAQMIDQTLVSAQAIPAASRSSALRTIAERLTYANYYQAAIQVAQAISEEPERLSKLNEAMEKALSLGDLATVLEVLQDLEEPVLKTRWLLTVADSFNQWGQPNAAVDVLNQALQTARTIPGEESQMIRLRGDENPLILDDEEDRGSFLSAIAIRLAQLNQVSQAQQAAQLLESRVLRQQVTQQISCYR